MDKQLRRIPAGRFKAECLRLMDEVARRRAPIVITKRGKPVAKLVPADERAPDVFGCMASTATVHGDIVEPIDVAWEATSRRCPPDALYFKRNPPPKRSSGSIVKRALPV